jgi:hypothetical protein
MLILRLVSFFPSSGRHNLRAKSTHVPVRHTRQHAEERNEQPGAPPHRPTIVASLPRRSFVEACGKYESISDLVYRLKRQDVPKKQGNHYNTPGGTNSSQGNSYHYSNTNGSYYYSNDNGSTYYSNPGGKGTYTAPKK